MREIRHNFIVLVALLTVAGIALAPLARAQSHWRKQASTHRDAQNLQICIDRLYRIIHCQVKPSPLPDNQALWSGPISTSIKPKHLFLQLKKGYCRQNSSPQHGGLLQTLFPNIPNLNLELERFAINIDMPSAFSDLDQSTIHMAYRNCW
jgi:hypothetical protein